MHLPLGRIVLVGLVLFVVAYLLILRPRDSARENAKPAPQPVLPSHTRPSPTPADPQRGFPVGAAELGTPRAQPLRMVDLNNGTLADLETLPGITPDDARRILAGRPYRAMRDLERVGIAHDIVEQISPPAIIWLNDKGDPTAAPRPGSIPPPAPTNSTP